VTAETIENSVERDSQACMIADSIKRMVPGATYPSADIQTIRFTKDGYRYTYITPRRVQEALILFDQGIKPEPFQFQLRTGQTTRAGSRSARRTGVAQPRTDAQREATKDAASMSTKAPGIQFVHGSGQANHVPEIRGGRVPPQSVLAGGAGVGSTVPPSRRRTFGLRAFDKMR
jgi:hypothetical protein